MYHTEESKTIRHEVRKGNGLPKPTLGNIFLTVMLLNLKTIIF